MKIVYLGLILASICDLSYTKGGCKPPECVPYRLSIDTGGNTAGLNDSNDWTAEITYKKATDTYRIDKISSSAAGDPVFEFPSIGSMEYYRTGTPLARPAKYIGSVHLPRAGKGMGGDKGLQLWVK